MARPTLKSLVSRYTWERRSASEWNFETARNTRYTLNGFAESVGDQRSPRSLREEDVLEWLARSGWSAATVGHRLSSLKQWAAWLCRRDHIQHDFARGIRGPRLPRPLPRALDPAVIGRAMTSCPDSRARVVILLMCQEGLRCVEVNRLDLGDVNLPEAIIVVRGKGGGERPVPLSGQTVAAIHAYLAEHPARVGPLVRSYSRGWQPLTPNYISKLVGGWLRDADAGDTAHSLRHSCATHMLKGGAHLRDVQQFLGHRHLSSTERYLAWEVRGLRDASGDRWYGPPDAA